MLSQIYGPIGDFPVHLAARRVTRERSTNGKMVRLA